MSTARVPATILPPSSPARCVHCLSDWPGRWRRHDTPAHRGPTAEKILEAAENCPVSAIFVEDAETGERLKSGETEKSQQHIF